MTISQLTASTRIDLFATPDANNVIDAEPEPPAIPTHPFGAGRHRLGSRPGMTYVYAITGIKPPRRRLFAPRPRLALLPGTGAK